jgi:hypothetical protein
VVMTFEFRRVYGRIKFYPTNPVALTICEIAERLCLDQTQLSKLLVLDSLQVKVSKDDEVLSMRELVALLTGATGERQTKGHDIQSRSRR